MSSGKKKGKKSKGKTINLNDFLAETATLSSNDNRNEYGEVVINVAALPTAPRAEQAGCYDESKVPDRPPFTAYVGNLPYDVEEEDLEKYFNDSKIVSIRFPSDSGSHKGFGYIEVEDKESLINILKCNGNPMHERCLRIDLATGGSRRDGDSNLNWRIRDGNSAYEDGSGRDGNRGGGFQQKNDADLDQTWVKKGNFSSSEPDDRSFGGRDRGFGGDRDRGFGGDRDRGFGGDRDRGFGGDRDRGFGGDRDRGFCGDRDRGFGGDRERGVGGDRDRRGYEEENLSWTRKAVTSTEPEMQQATGRKPLNLAKRTKPIETIVIPVETIVKPIEPIVKPERKPQNLFGDAKPVDTASKERMIEEKLFKLNTTERESSVREGYRENYTNSKDTEDNSKTTTTTTNEENKKVFVAAPVPQQSAWSH